MAFSKEKIITTVLTINLLLLLVGFPLQNHDVIFSFFTEDGANDYSTFDSENRINFGTDTSRTGTDTSIVDELESLKSTDNPVGTDNFFSDALSGLKLIGQFLILFVTYALGGIIAFAVSSGLPVYFYPFLLPVQIMYILSIINFRAGRS
jgi:hypothetical protein